jgi:apolipoprotein N-acyltransferase
MRLVAALCLLPGLVAVAVRWVFGGFLCVDTGTLVLEQRHRRIEMPVASIVGIEPWAVPLPGSGIWLRLRSGKRWTDGIEMEDPVVLIDALAGGGGSPRLGEVADHPSLIYARARSRSWRGLCFGTLLKFPVFALVPTIPLFRVHQIIAYGGALGEYYQYGLGAYLAGFAIYWATLTIYLMLYAAVLRVPVELVAVGTALLTPQHALRVRRVLDRLAAVLYYAGVPTAVSLRFVPW